MLRLSSHAVYTSPHSDSILLRFILAPHLSTQACPLAQAPPWDVPLPPWHSPWVSVCHHCIQPILMPSRVPSRTDAFRIICPFTHPLSHTSFLEAQFKSLWAATLSYLLILNKITVKNSMNKRIKVKKTAVLKDFNSSTTVTQKKSLLYKSQSNI